METIFSAVLLLGSLPHFSQDVYARTPNGVCEIKKLPAGRVLISRDAAQTSYFSPGTDNRLFMPLFRYIQKQKISMTTPVEVQVTPGEMVFHSLPAEQERIPITSSSDTPVEAKSGTESEASDAGSKVEVRDLPERWVASLGIRGEYSEEKFRDGTQKLLAWLALQSEYEVIGEAYMTYWNPPFIPWFLKHSEVNIPVRPRVQSRSAEQTRSDSQVPAETSADTSNAEFQRNGESEAARSMAEQNHEADISSKRTAKMERAIFAGGCFWGVEYWMEKLPGVQNVTSGYMGGKLINPTYEQVKTGETGHYEVVEVEYDPEQIDYEAICKRFLEIHDPTQSDGQGPDIGSQYRSAIFYADASQQQVAENLLQQLRSRGLQVATLLLPMGTFWPAEACHQDYYSRKGSEPYCHIPVKRF